jgi:hypothetical protein
MLINENLANLLVATEFGHITFNDKGENNELKPEEQKKLGALPGFKYAEEKKKPEPKVEVKEEAKKPIAKAKAPAKKEEK